jgi:aspartate/methionine/tyrosine aminotransferase
VAALLPSKIREIANLGMGRADVAAFWFGEGDRATPEFVRQAATMALDDGQTFYTQNLGRPKLRAEISRYVSGLHNAAVSAERVAVTGSGMSALMLSAQMLLSPGDEVVVVTPIWPNIAEIPRILGASVTRVPLVVRNGRWDLDLDRLLAALTPKVKAVFINSPNNPTGWMIDPESQRALFEHCRKLGIWIISDDVYERLSYRAGSAVAPSMLGYAHPEDRLISVNSFSKAWCMTGWRIGWLVAPEALMDDFGKIIEYNTSCVSDFVQQGALAALASEQGEVFVASLLDDLALSRQRLVDGLRRHAAIDVPEADGAMYAFFRIKGHEDSLALAYDLLNSVGLGLAPGSAFGPEGEGWLRWCFAARPAKIDDGLARLRRFLGS